jgi:hypothetical protein
MTLFLETGRGSKAGIVPAPGGEAATGLALAGV